jgi:DhnA family fructose-bisphosphate aldolase class Ia
MSEFDLLDTESGNAVVVALDHGIAKGALDGFADPRRTLEAVLAGGPDAIIARAPFVQRFADLIEAAPTAVVLAPDVLTFSTLPAQDDGDDMWTGAYSAEFLRSAEPSGVKVVLNFGRENRERHRANIEYIVHLYEELRGTGIPLIVEPVLWGSRVPDGLGTDSDSIADAARIGWELGGDILKLPYPGQKKAFGDIVDRTPVPTMILGGPATTPAATLADVEAAMAAGARGVMIGRSIWQTPDPAGMVEAMRQIVHEGRSADAVRSLAP